MGHKVKLCCLAIILLCTVTIGTPQNQDDVTDAEVYPLEKQDDVWFAGIRDTCELAGAKAPGLADAPFTIRQGPGGDGIVEFRGHVDALVVEGLTGKGSSIAVEVGEDTYTVTIGSVELLKNGERVWDLLHEPKRINGGACASLEDLAQVLDFTLGEEIDGQPAITKDDKTYRLVQGKPTPLSVQWTPREELFKNLPRPLIIEPREGAPGVITVAPQTPQKGYVEFDGALYQRANVGVLGPTQPGQAGKTLLYGPVIRNRYEVNGQLADQLFLSIVRTEEPPTGIVLEPGGMGGMGGLRLKPPEIGRQDAPE
jgi:hypothetical protein